MTEQELEDAIAETERQEALFRLADAKMQAADWIMARIKLRAQLHQLLMSKIR